MTENKFDWINFYSDLLKQVCELSNDNNIAAKKLYNIYKEAPEPKYNFSNYEKIDPLTFIAFISKNLKKYQTYLQMFFNINDFPQNDCGKPTYRNEKHEHVYSKEIFPDKSKTNDKPDIVFNNLWNFAREVNLKKIKEDSFSKLLEYAGIDTLNLSKFIFICIPDFYYPLDEKMRSYIGIKSDNSFSDFKNFQEECKNKYPQIKPYEVSYEAHLEQLEKDAKAKEENPYKYHIDKKMDIKDFTAIAMSFDKDKSYTSGEILNTPFIQEIKDIRPQRYQPTKCLQKNPEIFQNLGDGRYKLTEKGYKFALKQKNKLDEAKGQYNEIWFPQNYNPEIGVNDWRKLLNDSEIFDTNSLKLIKRLYDIGGQATCKQLEKKYGLTYHAYIGIAFGLAKRIHKKNNCPLPTIDNENAKWWPILFVGRSAGKQDEGIYIWKLREELKEAIELSDISDIELYENGDNNMTQPLNQILYGPPGTGKTYNTIIEAIKILDKSLYQRYYEYINNKDKKDFEFDAEKHATYEDLQTEFNNYKGQGRIEFITFHQSYSYEEFVEGIKPEIGTEDLKYNYDKGIFKQISQRALFERLNINKDKPQKILDFENLKDTFINNNDIGTQIQTEAKKSYIEITNYTENAIRVKPVKGSSTYSVFYRYIQKLLELDITERTSIKQYIPEAKGLASYYFAIINKFKELQNSSINTANTTTDISNISDEAKEQLINEYYKNCIDLKPIEECKSYVLIIDEINRGNISKIFGELITLIEDDKRAGGKHQLIVTLPYTKEQFAVPDNLYIIGTMNTADRSIALLDTALRRRFEFEEMPPRPELLKTDLTINGEEINLQKFLIGLNYNITEIGNLDKDHKIGHAFLINVNGREGLKRAFLNKIYPLLEEYFYDDDKKIKEVLNQDQKFDLSCLNNKTDKEEKWLNVIKDVIDKSEGNK